MKPLLLFLLFTPIILFSQDINYAHKIIDTLTSRSMHGRGEAENGDKIAAKYISDQFQSFGLNKFTDDFYQPYDLDIVTFPSKMFLKINYKVLVPGQDYIVHPSSGSGSGTVPVINVSRQSLKDSTKLNKLLSNNYKNKALLIDSLEYHDKSVEQLFQFEKCPENAGKRLGILIENKKLTGDVSQTGFYHPVFIVLRSALPKKVKTITYDVEGIQGYYESRNVIGYVKGSVYPDSFLVFSAHYDHLGEMGKDTYFPGANDNASGVAMLLNLAEYYSKKENTPKYSIAFIAFGNEEAGLVGSHYYVKHPLFPLSKIKFLVNMDIMGTGDEGMMVVNGSVFDEEYNRLIAINNKQHYLIDIPKRPKAANSDHYFFTEAGVRSFFFYTLGGIKAYHDIYDKPETLPLTKFEDIFRLIRDFVATFK